jgi:hypothetical protein
MRRDDRYVAFTITRSSLMAAAATFAFISAVVFVYVLVHELGYAGAHPHAYGPANIIAAAAGAGALLSIAVALVAAVGAAAHRGARSPEE